MQTVPVHVFDWLASTQSFTDHKVRQIPVGKTVADIEKGVEEWLVMVSDEKQRIYTVEVFVNGNLVNSRSLLSFNAQKKLEVQVATINAGQVILAAAVPVQKVEAKAR